MVDMDALGERLRENRAARGASLQAVSQPAAISVAYLHKLEAGRVHSPSPRVLRRLATVLDVPYQSLMELAGYLDSGIDNPSTQRLSPTGGQEMVKVAERAPTNERVVALLEALRGDIAQLKEQQDAMAERLLQMRDRQPADGREANGGR